MMKRDKAIGICVLLMLTLSARAEILDRMIAVVGDRMITLSDLRLEKRIREVLGIADAKDDKTILNELIDARIIDEQIAQFPGIDVTEAAVDKELSRISDRRGLPESVLRDAIRQRLRTDQFFTVRFRQFLRVSDDEIRTYYDNVFVPEARKRGIQAIPPLDQVSDMIRKSIIEEKTMHDVDNWLEATRRRTTLETFLE